MLLLGTGFIHSRKRRRQDEVKEENREKKEKIKPHFNKSVISWNADL